MANTVDLDQTPRYAAADLCLHCFLKSVCSNTTGKPGKTAKLLAVYCVSILSSLHRNFFTMTVSHMVAYINTFYAG